MMGKKKDKGCLTQTLVAILGVGYISANFLMLTMVIMRSLSLSNYKSELGFPQFPYECGENFGGQGCARIVLSKNSCENVESITE